MSAKNSHYATVKQEGPGKCPIMGEGDLYTKNARQYNDYCNGHFDVKDIPEDKQVYKVIVGIHDQWMKVHISTNHACIIALTFPEFLKTTGSIRNGKPQHKYSFFTWSKVRINPSKIMLLHYLHKTHSLWVPPLICPMPNSITSLKLDLNSISWRKSKAIQSLLHLTRMTLLTGTLK